MIAIACLGACAALLLAMSPLAAASATGHLGSQAGAQRAGAHSCSTDERGFCGDQILTYQLRFSEANPVVNINTAVGIGTTIELPPGARLESPPSLSNTLVFGLEGLDAENGWKSVRRFDVLTRKPENEPASFNMVETLGTVGRLTLVFKAGLTLLVRLKIVHERPEHNVERLILEFPELQDKETWVHERVGEVVAQWKDAYDRRVSQLDQEVSVRAVSERAAAKLERDVCKDLITSGERSLVIATVTKVCQQGDWMEARFTILNRSERSVFAVGNVMVSVDPESGYVLTGGTSTAQVRFDQSVEGIVWWALSKGVKGDIRIVESGGLEREIVISNVSF